LKCMEAVGLLNNLGDDVMLLSDSNFLMYDAYFSKIWTKG